MKRLSWLAPVLFLAGLTQLGGDPSPPAPLPEGEGRYFPVQLHLHGSLSEGDGTMRGHNAVAQKLGTVEGLWWTDHDFRISGHSMATGFGFNAERELYEVPERDKPWKDQWQNQIGVSFAEEKDDGIERMRTALTHPSHLLEDGTEHEEESQHALEIGAASAAETRGWKWAGVMLSATGGRLRVPLAADVELEILALVPAPPNERRRTVVRLDLSRQLEGLVELHYVLGGAGEPRVESRGGRRIGVVPIPVELGTWNRLVLSPTHDAILLGLGGRDNLLREIHLGLELRQGGSGRVSFDELRLRRTRGGAEILAWQQAETAALGQEYGLFNHVGLEVSYGVHMNAYLPKIELPDYERHPRGIPPTDLVAWAHERGGIVSYNHVFGTIDSQLPEYEERQRYVIENRAFGADLLEVGYPHRVLPLARHLQVWDELSRRGVVITGVGTSDSHSQSWGWEDGNNYITWVWSKGPGPEDLIAGLRSRRAFFGDPMLFKGTIEVRTVDAPMGAVIESDGKRHEVELEIHGLPAGAEVRWIEDGEVRRRFTPPAGDFRKAFRVDTRDLGRAKAPTQRFVRAEVWLGERGIAFSNPIYFVARALNASGSDESLSK